MKIVADDKIPFIKGVFEPFAKVVYLPGDRITHAELEDADALLTRSITTCDEGLLKGTAVRMIASATIGDDHIDKNYCTEAGIQWSAARGCNAEAVNQYFQAALGVLADEMNIELKGRVLGIIGVGNVGSRVRKTAELLGMETLLNDPPRERAEGAGMFCSLAEIQAHADVVSLHVPLTYGGSDKTFHLADQDFFAGFSKPVVFINTARGAVADSSALAEAAQEGKVTAMVLDVWENEPYPDPLLLEKAVIATPHIAGYSNEGKAMGSAMTVQAVSRFFKLGLDDWMPLREKHQFELKLECAGRTAEGVLAEIYRTVFPLSATTEALKRDPGIFETMRGNDAFRHENPNYILDLRHGDPHMRTLLKGLGFRLKKTD